MILEKRCELSIERIELATASSMIEATQCPVGAGLRAAMDMVIETECGQIARSVAERDFEELRCAEIADERAGTRLQEARTALTSAESAADAASTEANWVKALIWSLCGTACFAAEFVLTWHALSFLLNVERGSVLGVLLGLAPPSGLAVLEIFLARLFEDPWERLRASGGSARRAVAGIAMAVLLVTLAAVNVITVLSLAKAREEAGKAARALSNVNSDAEAAVDQHALDRAVLWVSLVVTVDGAIFLLLSLREAAQVRARKALKRGVRLACSRVDALETAAAVARSDAESRREAWKTVDLKSRLAADRYRAHCLARLAQKEEQVQLERPLEELVDRSLRLRIQAPQSDWLV